MADAPPRYRPIPEYAIIGDMRTAALVATDGSIDWCCFPRFDSPAIFCRLLDAGKGGWFRVGPAGPHTSSRKYLPGSNVLQTSFTTGTGQVTVTDFMPVSAVRQDESRDDVTPTIFRIVEGVGGTVDMSVEFNPTFDYARGAATVAPFGGGAIARAGTETLELAASLPLASEPGRGIRGAVSVRAGQRMEFAVRYGRAGGSSSAALRLPDAARALAETLRYWQGWSGKLSYDGPYAAAVQRSALTLKLLTFARSGAMVAAPTTSLPEEIGGARNWDYRYTWLRDASLALYAFQAIGYHEEARSFFEWLEALCLGCCGELQILYAVDGTRETPERTLDHLDGYRGSRPVRIGNAAAGQFQLDVYGQVLDAAHFCYERMRPIGRDLWTVLQYFADTAAARWREPDQGIWEIRGEPRHYLYSKLLCWVALDRAIRLADGAGLVARRHWRPARNEIRRAILRHGFDRELGAFTQAFGVPALDASVLALPLLGFLPPTDRRIRSTVERIREQLTTDSLVYRYRADDRLPPGEGTFALCSFWLVDNLALSGRIDEARSLFEGITGYSNDVGLLAEQIEPTTGELRGNFPQGFSHLGLINAALSIAKAAAVGAEKHAATPADRARTVEQTVTRP